MSRKHKKQDKHDNTGTGDDRASRAGAPTPGAEAPSDRERGGWYFQRYVPHLPVAEELVLFNRSWYNRAGVEHVMGFCTEEQHAEFMQSVPKLEEMLVGSGSKLLKYYLDVSKDEQAKRLDVDATRSNSGSRARSMLWRSSIGRRTPTHATPC